MADRDWIVFVDIDYYPDARIVSAATVEDAIRIADVELEATGTRWDGDEDGAVVFVAPMDAVAVHGSRQRVEWLREDATR